MVLRAGWGFKPGPRHNFGRKLTRATRQGITSRIKSPRFKTRVGVLYSGLGWYRVVDQGYQTCFAAANIIDINPKPSNYLIGFKKYPAPPPKLISSAQSKLTRMKEKNTDDFHRCEIWEFSLPLTSIQGPVFSKPNFESKLPRFSNKPRYLH